MSNSKGSVMLPLDLLREGARHLGVTLLAEQEEQLSCYLDVLLFWSARIDLVSQRDPAEIIRKHVLDALAAVHALPEATTLLDLGSGAGFPGVPAAILRPQLHVSLLEIRRKRANFLRDVKRKLGSGNLTIHEGRAEELAQTPALRGAFDLVITRATWNLPTFLQRAAPFLRDHGRAMAMQGPSSAGNIPLTVSVEEGSKFCLTDRLDYRLPFGGEQRVLLGFTKHRET